jgi:hypothetical protein
MGIELALTLIAAGVLAGLSVMLAITNAGLRQTLVEAREQYRDEVVANRKERQQLLDRIQSNGELPQYLALREQHSEEEEPTDNTPDEESWRTAARNHPEFSDIADELDVIPSNGNEPALLWVPTDIDKGYTMPLSEFREAVGDLRVDASRLSE